MKKLLILFSIIIVSACNNANSSQEKNSDTAKLAVANSLESKEVQAVREAEAQKQASVSDTARKPLPIPNYRILTTDSVWVTRANLKPNKPVMIVYFSPDCPHCTKMMYELQPKMKQLANVQVVMITWSQKYDIRGIKIFKRDFDLKKYPNFTIGTEGYTAFVTQHYKILTTPFIAMYHANRKWAKYFDKDPKTEVVLAAVKKL